MSAQPAKSNALVFDRSAEKWREAAAGGGGGGGGGGAVLAAAGAGGSGKPLSPSCDWTKWAIIIVAVATLVIASLAAKNIVTHIGMTVGGGVIGLLTLKRIVKKEERMSDSLFRLVLLALPAILGGSLSLSHVITNQAHASWFFFGGLIAYTAVKIGTDCCRPIAQAAQLPHAIANDPAFIKCAWFKPLKAGLVSDNKETQYKAVAQVIFNVLNDYVTKNNNNVMAQLKEFPNLFKFLSVFQNDQPPSIEAFKEALNAPGNVDFLRKVVFADYASLKDCDFAKMLDLIPSRLFEQGKKSE